MSRRMRGVGVVLAVALAMSACSAADTEPPADATVRASDPQATLTVIADASEVDAAIATSRALFEAAPLVVIAASGDPGGQELGAQAAIGLGVPLLVAPATDDATAAPTVASELQRLATTTAVVVGSVAPLPAETGDPALTVERVEATADAVRETTGVPVGAAGDSGAPGAPAGIVGFDGVPTDRAGAVPRPARAAPLTDTMALAVDDVHGLAPIATARAAGVPVQLVPEASTDPLSSASLIEALHASTTSRTLAIGTAFGAEPALDWKVRAARSGFQLPGGGQLVFDERQFVALYGTPSTSALGVLGEQGPDASVQRAREIAAPYEALTDETVVPMFEVIATVASGGPGPDGDYSNELPVEDLRPLVDAAVAAGVYVVLDLQPGRTDFLTQAQRYRSLLELPNVGLALDPEWRLAPDEVHLRQIGSVSAAEVNSVVTWLADLTNELGLPQKMLVLHQFRLDMITDRQALDLSRPELAVLIHVDGLGTQPAKQATWAALQHGAPAGLHWGWKNFIDEDLPMLTPEQTMRQVSPLPDLVTYQ